MMQSLSGSFEQSGKPSDAWHKISLPERKPSDCWRSPDKEDGVSPLSTGVTSPGLISLSTVESTEKETYLQNFAEAPEVVPQTPLPPRQVKRRKWRYWILALVICIVVGLAVGLGVGLTRERY